MSEIDDIKNSAEVVPEGEWPDKPQPPKEPEYSDELIEAYRAFKEQVHDAKSVLHPSCAYDASPARVFANVTFVDREDPGSKGAMGVFRKHGLKAFRMDIRV